MLFFSSIYFFFSISTTTHRFTRFDFIYIYHFSKDSDSLSFQVSSTSDTPPNVRPIYTHHFAGIDILLFNTREAPFSSIVLQASYEIVNPLLRQSTHICKSTKLPYFAYSYYSLLFISFLAFIHCLSKLFFL
jgi:hypothetical protein